jgi:hypothetical protein
MRKWADLLRVSLDLFDPPRCVRAFSGDYFYVACM